ncbi:MAG TPA: hypothetical protein VHW25_17115 [Steroidobacteraceae bacterium]|jgi:hypothetical protein|nr:hypothetical protein [Steroidobacteraceae bacterium]
MPSDLHLHRSLQTAIAPHHAPAPRRYATLLRAGFVPGCCLLLSGCTVGFWSYQQIAAPEAQYVQVNCDGHDGPPKLTYYPFHEIFIGVAVEPLDLRLRTPRGVHAHLDGDSVVVSGHTDKGNLELTLKLKTAAEASDAGSLAEMRFEERHDSGWAPGVPSSETQIDTMSTGTIRLPPITIDNTPWPSQSLPFTRKIYSQVMQPKSACTAQP